MTLKIALIGASGRMGQMVQKACSEQGIRITSMWGRTINTQAELQAPDVIVDFSLPKGTYVAAQLAQVHDIALVTGTTGLSEQEQAAVEQAAKHVAVVQSSNFSIGMNLLFHLAQEAARYLPPSFKASIEEVHHIHKKDKPSGTAISLKKAFLNNSDNSPDIPIIAHRKGSTIGIHSLSLKSSHETISLTHEAFDRSIYAEGALFAALGIKDKAPGLYAFKDLVLNQNIRT